MQSDNAERMGKVLVCVWKEAVRKDVDETLSLLLVRDDELCACAARAIKMLLLECARLKEENEKLNLCKDA